MVMRSCIDFERRRAQVSIEEKIAGGFSSNVRMLDNIWGVTMTRSVTMLMGLMALAVSTVAAPAVAQKFPAKGVHVIVPFPPGSADVTVRQMQPVMEKAFGQPLIVENKTGANGYVGTEYVARSKPDGYTMLFTATSSIV